MRFVSKPRLLVVLSIGTAIGALIAIVPSVLASKKPTVGCNNGCGSSAPTVSSIPISTFSSRSEKNRYLIILGQCSACQSLSWLPSNISVDTLRKSNIAIAMVPPLSKLDDRLSFASEVVSPKKLSSDLRQFFPAIFKVDRNGFVTKSIYGAVLVRLFMESEFK